MFFALVPGSSGGCFFKSEPCAQGLEEGAAYRLTIEEPYDPQATLAKYDPEFARIAGTTASLSCGPGFDLPNGATLDIRVNKFVVSNLCTGAAGTLLSASSVPLGKETLSGRENGGRSGNFIGLGDYQVTPNPDCAGIWELSLRSEERHPLRLNDPSQLPSVVVYRRFFSPSPSCPATRNAPSDFPSRCSDSFIATMRKLLTSKRASSAPKRK